MEEDIGLDVLSATRSPIEGGSEDAALSPQARNRRRLNAAADPLPAGPENIDTAPAFVNAGSGYGTNYAAGNCRLKSDSPCINAGTNLPWMTDPADLRSRDLDGNPRIASEVVDMGAYEAIPPAGTLFTIR